MSNPAVWPWPVTIISAKITIDKDLLETNGKYMFAKGTGCFYEKNCALMTSSYGYPDSTSDYLFLIFELTRESNNQSETNSDLGRQRHQHGIFGWNVRGDDYMAILSPCFFLGGGGGGNFVATT